MFLMVLLHFLIELLNSDVCRLVFNTFSITDYMQSNKQTSESRYIIHLRPENEKKKREKYRTSNFSVENVDSILEKNHYYEQRLPITTTSTKFMNHSEPRTSKQQLH